jgi:RNA polymerase sigma-70 factor (ECF subfamily)
MLVREDGRAASEPLSQVGGEADREHVEAIGGVIDAFRDYLVQLAGREIGPDLAAKVSASDIVQETFLAAGRDYAQFQGASPVELRGWLTGILKHLVMNTRRRYRETGKRHVGLEIGAGEAAGGMSARISATVTSPSACAMRQEREYALHRVLMGLPEHYRQVIQWHHQDHLPFDAIAGRLGVSSEAARKVWGRALLRLREALGPDHDPG